MTAAATDEAVLVAARRHRLIQALADDDLAQPQARTAREALLDELLLERYAPGPRPLSTPPSTSKGRLSTGRSQAIGHSCPQAEGGTVGAVTITVPATGGDRGRAGA